MEIIIQTQKHSQMVDITPQVKKAVASAKIGNGLVHIFSLHTTAGITINENADPDVPIDMMDTLDGMVPWENNYRHREGNSAAHVKTTLVGSSESVAVENGDLILGTWQSIFFCEFDGPRQRRVQITLMPASV